VLRTYGKVAVRAQKRTNCITELLLPEAESWLESEVNLKGPLAGIPISLKDSVHVKGFDSTLGYSALAGKPFAEDGPMVKMLKDAGMYELDSMGGRLLIYLQELFPTLRLHCLLRFSPLSLPTDSGATVSIPMSLGTLPVVQLAAKLLSLHREVALVSALMSPALYVCPLPGAVSTRSAAARVVGPRSASVPVWPARRAFRACLVRWLAR
jgi:hypothetical protein